MPSWPGAFLEPVLMTASLIFLGVTSSMATKLGREVEISLYFLLTDPSVSGSP